jgi:hypothetical protein
MSLPDDVPMSVLEQRLRDAFAAAAETVAPHSIGDLPRPVARRRRAVHRGLARWQHCRRPGGWDRQLRPPRFYEQALIPLAAAAAVTLIATAMTVVVPKAFPAAPAAHSSAHPARIGTESGHPLALAPASALVAGYPRHRLPRGAAPRYFVGIQHLSVATRSRPVPATALAVFSSATGRAVASIGQPARGRYYQAVAALGSDQTFVAAAVPTSGADCSTWFYRFSLSPHGQLTGWRPLSVAKVTGEVRYNNALAASANGNVIAYSASMCTQNFASQVGVIRLDTGTVCTWPTLRPAMPRTLSLSANGGVLSFVGNPSDGSKGGSPAKDAAWTLRTSATPGPLARHYQRVLRAPGGVQSVMLSPTGAIMFAMIASNPRSRTVSNSYVNAYDVATGKLLGLVQIVRYGSHNPGFSPDTSGQYVLIYPAEQALFQELDLVTGRLVTVSVPQQGVPFAAAW